jgi:hypothetical protein
MTITKTGLKEEMSSLTRFIYQQNLEKWIEFCNKERSGNQSLENISMLISTTTTPTPSRIVIQRGRINKILDEVARSRGKVTYLLMDLVDVADKAESEDEI